MVNQPLMTVLHVGCVVADVFVGMSVSALMRVLASSAEVELLMVGQIGSSCE